MQGQGQDGRPVAGTGAFGPNAWLVEDMYERYQVGSVLGVGLLAGVLRRLPADRDRAGRAVGRPAGRRAGARRPPPATAARRHPRRRPRWPGPRRCGAPPDASWPTWRRRSGVPTATSVRVVPAKLLEVNRTIVNNQLQRTTGGKVSFTHLIGYAVVKALMAVPAMNAAFVEDADGKGTPGVLRHDHVGLGLAVDVEKGTRPDAAGAVHRRCRHPGLPGLRRRLRGPGPQDPHQQDRPGRLRRHHGHPDQPRHHRHGPVGAPADARPGRHRRRRRPRGAAGLRGHRPAHAGRARRGQDGDRHVHLRPPDHPGRRVRPLPGLRLRVPHGRARLLRGGVRVARHPLRAGHLAARTPPPSRRPTAATSASSSRTTCRPSINMYRVRGHLIAHLDPLDAEPVELHPELDPLHYGLTIWDLPRTFVADGLAGKQLATLDEILSVLRDAYCRTLGVEYMHIQDPEQKRWIQQHVEGVSAVTPPDEQRHILDRLNAAEVFERFLHTRYVGQKRFGLEGRRVGHRHPRRPAQRGRRRGAARVGHGHGPPRPAQRAGQHRRQVLRRDLRGVRGEPRPRVGPGLG